MWCEWRCSHINYDIGARYCGSMRGIERNKVKKCMRNIAKLVRGELSDNSHTLHPKSHKIKTSGDLRICSRDFLFSSFRPCHLSQIPICRDSRAGLFVLGKRIKYFYLLQHYPLSEHGPPSFSRWKKQFNPCLEIYLMDIFNGWKTFSSLAHARAVVVFGNLWFYGRFYNKDDEVVQSLM